MIKDQHSNPEFIKRRFDNISRFYNLLNSVLSLGIDRYWRLKTVRSLVFLFPDLPNDPNKVVLDLCAGTLPLSWALKKWTGFKGKIVALDFAFKMLAYGLNKHPDKDKDILPVAGDALVLPLKDHCADAVMVAFGVRNFSDRFKGLCEMRRILKPGGKAIILEFSHPPRHWIKEFYFAYLNHLLPQIGAIISQDKEAYEHLSASIQSFYTPKQWMQLMKRAGFKNIKHRYLTFGIVSLYLADV